MRKEIEFIVKVKDAETEKHAKETLNVLKELQKQGMLINREKEFDEFGNRQFYSLQKKDQRDKRYKEVEIDYQKMKKFYDLPRKEKMVDEKEEDTGWLKKGLNFLSSFLTKKEAAGVEAIKSMSPDTDLKSAFRKGEKPWMIREDNWNNDLKTFEMHDMEDDIEEVKNQIPKAIAEYEKQLAIYRETLSASLGEQIQTMPDLIKDAINSYQAEDKDWEFSDHANDLYTEYFKKRREQYEGNAQELQKIQEEEAERQRLLLEHSSQTEKEALEKTQVARLAAEKQKEELAAAEGERIAKQQAREATASEFKEELRNKEIKGLKEVAGLQVDTSIIQKNLAAKTESLTQQSESTEGKSLKTRAEQWEEYAQKIAATSQKVSEVTGMVTKSLGGMFSQLSASYAQELESINEKIGAIDEQKEAALEKVALTEDQRRTREDELAAQRQNSMYASTHEEKNVADERIAILQSELGAEDTVKREFEDKKAHLEKEKEKKEKAQKKAQKQQKRLEMSQSIVEAIGNIAQGAAKALSHGPILGPILAAVVSAAGAIQVGIMTKQLSKMEDGGFLQGKRHSQGGMRIQGSNIEVEGGEYVINRQSTGKNLGLLHYINEQRRPLNSDDMHSFFSSPLPRFHRPQYLNSLEKGGQVPMLPVEIDISNRELLAGIQNIKIQPRVAVTDIMHVHDQMVKVDEWAGF